MVILYRDIPKSSHDDTSAARHMYVCMYSINFIVSKSIEARTRVTVYSVDSFILLINDSEQSFSISLSMYVFFVSRLVVPCSSDISLATVAGSVLRVRRSTTSRSLYILHTSGS